MILFFYCMRMLNYMLKLEVRRTKPFTDVVQVYGGPDNYYVDSCGKVFPRGFDFFKEEIGFFPLWNPKFYNEGDRVEVYLSKIIPDNDDIQKDKFCKSLENAGLGVVDKSKILSDFDISVLPVF